jgi:hypothetical protein
LDVAVVDQVPRGVILIPGSGEPVVRAERLVESIASPAGQGLVGAVAPGVVGPVQSAACVSRAGKGQQTVQRIVAVAAAERLCAASRHRGQVAIVARAQVEVIGEVLNVVARDSVIALRQRGPGRVDIAAARLQAGVEGRSLAELLENVPSGPRSPGFGFPGSLPLPQAVLLLLTPLNGVQATPRND